MLASQSSVIKNTLKKMPSRTFSSLFPGDPAGPVRATPSFPGPKTIKAKESLDSVFDTRAAYFVTDYSSCKGNYIADLDGNLLLDVYAQISSIAVGYNHPHLIEACKSDEMVRALVDRPALGNFPSADYEEILKTGLLKIAPPGLNYVWTALSGSDANETAYKAAFMYKRYKERQGADFSPLELSSTMENQTPGSADLSILSFEHAFHGRLFGSLSTTRSKPIHKLDIPAFKWPKAPFPALKFPLDEYSQENSAREQASLEAVENILKTNESPVAAVIVEPIQSEGGDNHASPDFFRRLQKIVNDNGALFIVDEVQTGLGATGKLWAHQHWDLPTPPDIVTFSKKVQAAGYFFKDPELRPNLPYRQFNTWCGDPTKALIARAIYQVIESQDLVSHTAKAGEYLYNKLSELSIKYPNEITQLRGKDRGTYIAWTSSSPQARDAFLVDMKQAGVNIGGCGPDSVRLRPTLTFGDHHTDILIETIDKVLSATK